MKKVKLELEGGFHGAAPIKVTISHLAVDSKGHVDLSYLSPRQMTTLEKHFCGIKDCSCFSYTVAKIFVIGWTKYTI